jgi:hypothetical protein
MPKLRIESGKVAEMEEEGVSSLSRLALDPAPLYRPPYLLLHYTKLGEMKSKNAWLGLR